MNCLTADKNEDPVFSYSSPSPFISSQPHGPPTYFVQSLVVVRPLCKPNQLLDQSLDLAQSKSQKARASARTERDQESGSAWEMHRRSSDRVELCPKAEVLLRQEQI